MLVLKMAFQQLVFLFALMTILLCKGGQSQLPACARAVTESRIVGGQDAPPGKWPWHVYFEIGSSFCQGSLITDQWVLTSAHCMTHAGISQAVVYLGLQNRSGPNPNEITRTVDTFVCHPLKDTENFINDVCLLKLSSPVTFTNYIQPVCLASENSTFYDGTPSWVTGFGFTGSGSQPETLQEVEVPIVGINRCKCYYKDMNVITESMICAGLKDGGKDACQGDSGGPLVTKKDFYWVQSGVVSFGDGCARPMRPGVYSRVSQYQEWISETVTGMEPGFVTFTSPGTDSDLNFICSGSSRSNTNTPTTTLSLAITVCTTNRDDSIFSGSENLIHVIHYIFVFVLALFPHIFVWSG